jgi:hypothetical protein
MRRPPVRFTVRGLILAVFLAAIILGSLVTTLRSIRLTGERKGREGGCYSSLNNIALALHAYSEVNGRFPPPFEADARGERKHSWRALILPWLTGAPPTDRIRSSEVPGFLQCPSRRVENPHGSPFVMVNDFSDSDIGEIPANAVLVLEIWGANRDWLDPRDRFETSPRIEIPATDHPIGFGVILRDFSVVRVRDASRIEKRGRFYVLDR